MRVCKMCAHAEINESYNIVYRGRRLISSGTRKFRVCRITGKVVDDYDERATTCEYFKEWENWQLIRGVD